MIVFSVDNNLIVRDIGGSDPFDSECSSDVESVCPTSETTNLEKYPQQCHTIFDVVVLTLVNSNHMCLHHF